MNCTMPLICFGEINRCQKPQMPNLLRTDTPPAAVVASELLTPSTRKGAPRRLEAVSKHCSPQRDDGRFVLDWQETASGDPVAAARISAPPEYGVCAGLREGGVLSKPHLLATLFSGAQAGHRGLSLPDRTILHGLLTVELEPVPRAMVALREAYGFYLLDQTASRHCSQPVGLYKSPLFVI